MRRRDCRVANGAADGDAEVGTEVWWRGGHVLTLGATVESLSRYEGCALTS